MTNADKIRQMSDEELAKLLCSLCRCTECKAVEYCYTEHTGFVDWLKREAEGGADG